MGQKWRGRLSRRLNAGDLGRSTPLRTLLPPDLGTSHRDAFFGAMQLKIRGIESKRSVEIYKNTFRKKSQRKSCENIILKITDFENIMIPKNLYRFREIALRIHQTDKKSVIWWPPTSERQSNNPFIFPLMPAIFIEEISLMNAMGRSRWAGVWGYCLISDQE